MIEINLTNKKLKWVIGTCIVLAALSMFGTFLMPDSMQNVEQLEAERHIARYIMLSISFSLLLIIAFGFWIFLLWKQKRLKREKWVEIGCTLGIVLLCSCFYLWNAFNFYRRFHAVTFQEMVEKNVEGTEPGPTP